MVEIGRAAEAAMAATANGSGAISVSAERLGGKRVNSGGTKGNGSTNGGDGERQRRDNSAVRESWGDEVQRQRIE